MTLGGLKSEEMSLHEDQIETMLACWNHRDHRNHRNHRNHLIVIMEVAVAVAVASVTSSVNSQVLYEYS